MFSCVQYVKPWPHSDIRSCCHQSAHVFTSRYDSTLLGRIFFTPKVFLDEIYIYVHTYVYHIYIFIYYNAGIPSGVMNVRIRNDNISELFVVLWDEVMDIFTITYNVTWYDESGIIGMDTVNSPPYTVTGLTANTSYSITVVAINTCCGAGPVSAPVEAMTNMREPTSSPTHSPGNVAVCMYLVVKIRTVS